MKSRIFTTAAILFFLGVATQPFFEIEAATIFYISAIFIICSLIFLKNRILFAAVLGFGFFFLGLGMSAKQERYFLKLNMQYSQNQQEITAEVIEIPAKNEFGYSAKIQSIKDKMVFVGYFNNEIKYKQIVRFDERPNLFKQDQKGRLIKEKVAATIYIKEFESIGFNQEKDIKDYLYFFRIRFNEAIKRSLPVNEANLASGLILGEKALFSAETKRFLQASGTSHIIALSGYNITILLSLFLFTKKRFSRKVNFFLPLVFILLFVLMTGGSASIVRAGIMGFMPILAAYLYRPKNTFIAIIFSAFLMVALNPFVLLYDVGFQLSFLAMFGICYLSPIVRGFIKKEGILVNLFSETLGAQIAVLPLLMYYFGQVSIISPLSNLIILLFVPLGMFVSFLVGLSGMFSVYLSQIVSIPSFVVLKIINVLIKFFGGFEYSSLSIKVDNLMWVFVFYLIIFNIYIFTYKRSSARP